MKEECVICSSPLVYIKNDVEMECEICHKKEPSKSRCIKGHYVCDSCHTQGLDEIIGICLKHSSRNPIEIFKDLFSMPFCHIHGPEHHILVGASLLTAYKNAGGDIDLNVALREIISRAKKVPGGACGFWGACGAGVSSGMFISIITGSTPLANKEWGLSNLMTSTSLQAIGKIGGPRCCKRNSYLAILSTAKFVKQNLDVEMEISKIVCNTYDKNNQCIKNRCPFYKS